LLLTCCRQATTFHHLHAHDIARTTHWWLFHRAAVLQRCYKRGSISRLLPCLSYTTSRAGKKLHTHLRFAWCTQRLSRTRVPGFSRTHLSAALLAADAAHHSVPLPGACAPSGLSPARGSASSGRTFPTSPQVTAQHQASPQRPPMGSLTLRFTRSHYRSTNDGALRIYAQRLRSRMPIGYTWFYKADACRDRSWRLGQSRWTTHRCFTCTCAPHHTTYLRLTRRRFSTP